MAIEIEDTELPQQEPPKESPAPPCSRLMGAPETERAWMDCLTWCENRNESHDPHHAELANLSEKMEMDRNLLADHLKTLISWGETMWKSRPDADRFDLPNVALESAKDALNSVIENAEVCQPEKNHKTL